MPPFTATIEQPEADELYYKFETCTCLTYYVEVHNWCNSLTAAVGRLKSVFGVDADEYHVREKWPLVQKIEVVSRREVMAAMGRPLVYVSFLEF